MTLPSSFVRSTIEGRREVGLTGVTTLLNFLANQAGVITVVDDSEEAGCQHLSATVGYWTLLPNCVPILPEKPLNILVRTDTYPMRNMFLEMIGSVSSKGVTPGWALTSKDDFWGYVFLDAKKALLLHRESFMAWFETQPEAEQLENWKTAQATHLKNNTKIDSRGALLAVNRILEAGQSNWATVLDVAAHVPSAAQAFVKERHAN